MKTSRRTFLGRGVAAAAVAGTIRATADGSQTTFLDIIRPPHHVTAYTEGSGSPLRLQRSGGRWQAEEIEITIEPRQGQAGPELPIVLASSRSALKHVHLCEYNPFEAIKS